MKHYFVVVAFLLSACSATESDFTMGPGAPNARARDYAACRNEARQTASGYGGLANLLTYNETLDDCMRAKGYASVD